MHLLRILLTLPLLAFAIEMMAQKGDTLLIHQRCLLIAATGDSILRGGNDTIKTINSELLRLSLDSLLLLPASWHYSFSTLKNISVLSSADDKMKVYTWMLPLKRGMLYEYCGFVQLKDEKENVSTFPLKEKKYASNNETEFLRLNDTTWFGAIYYKLITKKYGKKSQYILLGWQGKDLYSTRKVMEPVSYTATRIEFGKPVFKAGGKARSRIILEYNAQANVSLNYNEQMKMIVYDHLSSSDPRPESKGMYQLYGPDMTYEGLKFKDGFWLLQKNIDVKNKKDQEPKDVKLNRDLRMQRKD